MWLIAVLMVLCLLQAPAEAVLACSAEVRMLALGTACLDSSDLMAGRLGQRALPEARWRPLDSKGNSNELGSMPF